MGQTTAEAGTYWSKRHSISPVSADAVVPYIFPVDSHRHGNDKEDHGNKVQEGSNRPHGTFCPPSWIALLESLSRLIRDNDSSHDREDGVESSEPQESREGWTTISELSSSI